MGFYHNCFCSVSRLIDHTTNRIEASKAVTALSITKIIIITVQSWLRSEMAENYQTTSVKESEVIYSHIKIL